MQHDSAVGNIGLSASSESIYQTKHGRSRGSLRHRPHRTSSRRNKENGSGSFRRKNSFKKTNVLAITENVKKLNCTVQNSGGNGDGGGGNGIASGGNGSNSTLNGDKLFKLSFPNSSSNNSSMIDATSAAATVTPVAVAQNKSHTVTFGEMATVSMAAKSDPIVPMDQELHDPSFSCEFQIKSILTSNFFFYQ